MVLPAALVAHRHRQISLFTAQVVELASHQCDTPASFRRHGTAAAATTRMSREAGEATRGASLVKESLKEVPARQLARSLERDLNSALATAKEPFRTPPPPIGPTSTRKATAPSPRAVVGTPLLRTLRTNHLASPTASPESLIHALSSNKTGLTLPTPPLPPPPLPNGHSREKLVNTLLLQAIVLGAGALGLLRRGSKSAISSGEEEVDAPEGESHVRAKIKRSHLDDGEGVLSLNLLIASYVWRPTLTWPLPSSEGTPSEPREEILSSSITSTQLLSLVRQFSSSNVSPDRFTILSLLSYLYLPNTDPSVRYPVLIWIWRSFHQLQKTPDCLAVDQIVLAAILDLFLRASESVAEISTNAQEIALEIIDGLAEVIFDLTSSVKADLGTERRTLLNDLATLASRLAHFPVLNRVFSDETLHPRARLDLSINHLLSLQTTRDRAAGARALQVTSGNSVQYRNSKGGALNARTVAQQVSSAVLSNVKACMENGSVEWERVEVANRYLLKMLAGKEWKVDVALDAILGELVLLVLLHGGKNLSGRKSTHYQPDFITSVLMYLVQARHPRIALAIFEAIPNDSRTSADYDALLSSHHEPTSSTIWHLLLHHQSLTPTHHSLSSRLKSHSNPSNNNLVAAYNSTNAMLTRGLLPNLREYNQILKIAATAGSDRTFRRVRFRMIRQLEKAGLPTADKATRNIELQRELTSARPRVNGQAVEVNRHYTSLNQVSAFGSTMDRLAKQDEARGSKALPPTDVTTSLMLKGLTRQPHSISTKDLLALAMQLLQIDLESSEPGSTFRSTKKEFEGHRRAKYLLLIKALDHRGAKLYRSRLIKGMRAEEMAVRQ